VGRGGTTDFYTSVSLGPVFGELVTAAVEARLGPESPERFTFVEIGAEPGTSVLDGVSHRFGQHALVRLGDPLEVRGPAVVFANELFDAQPFRRFLRRRGAWLELGVALRSGGLAEVEMDVAQAPWLPAEAREGYRFDAPRAAADLLASLAAQPWYGLFVAIDYGKSWDELASACPEGTARGYHRHRPATDLLARPGEQDLTADVCWDWLTDELRTAGFRSIALESQETFFVRHAGARLAAMVEGRSSAVDPRKRALAHLLHPAHLGRRFQVLHALRSSPSG
jgi:SAM-dependent MidA family methyltransferase